MKSTPAHRPLQHFPGLRCRVADVLPHQIIARHRNQVAFAHVTQTKQDLAMRSATVVLPVPGLPVKLMCRLGACACSPRFMRRLVDHEQRGDVTDAAFDRCKAHHVAVELVHHPAAWLCASHFAHGARAWLTAARGPPLRPFAGSGTGDAVAGSAAGDRVHR